MATQLAYMDAPTATIPLLDASDLPYADDWAVLEAIQADGDFGSTPSRTSIVSGGSG